jgi:hypothetical protein
MANPAPAALATPPTPGGESVRNAVACFLTERDLAPSSERVYALALRRLGEQLAPNSPLSGVTPATLLLDAVSREARQRSREPREIVEPGKCPVRPAPSDTPGDRP